MKKSLVICLIIFYLIILSVVFVNARLLTDGEIEEIRSRFNSASSIKDFKINSDLFLLPNSYKSVSYITNINGTRVETNEIQEYKICNSDKWVARFGRDQNGNGFLVKAKLSGIWNFILRFFRGGICSQEIGANRELITPEKYLTNRKNSEFKITFEYPDEKLNGKEVLKITSNHSNPKSDYITNTISYYDKSSFLIMKTERIGGYPGKDGILGKLIVKEYNVSINTGIDNSEFELIIPEGAEFHEVSLKEYMDKGVGAKG